jgi:hypothetical protein
MNPKYVYLAGPMSKGPLLEHVRNAMDAATRIRKVGGVPYLPQLGVLWELRTPQPYEEWMSFDFAWIERCDCLVRLPGESSGADREIEHAKKHGKQVFIGVESWLEHHHLSTCMECERRLQGMHVWHCCKVHGCKYGERSCPVVLETLVQKYFCEECTRSVEPGQVREPAVEQIIEHKEGSKITTTLKPAVTAPLGNGGVESMSESFRNGQYLMEMSVKHQEQISDIVRNLTRANPEIVVQDVVDLIVENGITQFMERE